MPNVPIVNIFLGFALVGGIHKEGPLVVVLLEELPLDLFLLLVGGLVCSILPAPLLVCHASPPLDLLLLLLPLLTLLAVGLHAVDLAHFPLLVLFSLVGLIIVRGHLLVAVRARVLDLLDLAAHNLHHHLMGVLLPRLELLLLPLFALLVLLLHLFPLLHRHAICSPHKNRFGHGLVHILVLAVCHLNILTTTFLCVLVLNVQAS
mmetsp:Transcript_113844/g.197838  ORF Transcript_113844/g.197838 Transcript_113844/m.197838 type:complete len:205 (-) Transcript_113844:576-1190(-)